jgi:hypothetical protein
MKRKNRITTRKDGDQKLNYRSMAIRATSTGTPASLNEEQRSVEVIGATEAPVDVFDFERYEVVPEILLMSGCEMPGNRQVPLLNTHMRFDGVGSVLGSFRSMQIEGDQLVGRVHFSTVGEAEGAFQKLREGHLTDFSAGYRPVKSVWVPDGERAIIEGRSFEGPVKVTTRWRIKELSICPIGADELAKARSETEPPPKGPEMEKEAMNKKLREWLEKRGLSADATEEDAWAFYVRTLEKLGPGEEKAPAATPDTESVRVEAIRIERERVTEIRALCKRHNCEDLAEALISDGTDLELAGRKVLDYLADNQPKVPHRNVEILADERDKFRSAAEHSILLRGGSIIETPAPGSADLMGFSLRELARESLRITGQKTGGNVMEMVGRAMQTADFPLLLANVANKSLFEGWETAEETWDTWCATGSVSDFKTHHLPRASEADDLDEIPEHVPYRYGTRTEAEEQYSVVTYGKMFAITRQAIINDDLGALTDIPRSHGESAARKIGDLPYAVLTANANMGDGTALFAAGHSNLTAAGALRAVPGTAPIAEAIRAMGTQTDMRGLRRLNIRPVYFLAPKALEGASEVFFRSNAFSDHQVVPAETAFASTRVNPYSGTYFTRVYEPRLDAASTTQYYFAARKGKTVTVFFLNGQRTPYMETKQGWSVDGVEYKVRIDAGAKALDWRGLYCNPGA